MNRVRDAEHGAALCGRGYFPDQRRAQRKNDAADGKREADQKYFERAGLKVGHADQSVCFLPNFWREVEESERFERHARVILCI